MGTCIGVVSTCTCTCMRVKYIRVKGRSEGRIYKGRIKIGGIRTDFSKLTLSVIEQPVYITLILGMIKGWTFVYIRCYYYQTLSAVLSGL